MKHNHYSITVEVEGGKGGDGLISFRHAPHQPRGGPDGGDGGKGGNIIIRADSEYHSLSHLNKQNIIKANNGFPGNSKKKHGKNGNNTIIPVPAGTIIYNEKERSIIAELRNNGEEKIVAQGGIGGKGNINFATSTNQAPRKATPGKDGEKKNLRFEYSPIIDAAVIGTANTGKSSLIAAITGGKPVIADYPFTTKEPRLWTLTYEYKRFTFMDTPPVDDETVDYLLIVIKRAKFLIVVLDEGKNELAEQFEYIEDRVISHFRNTLRKEIIVAINKIDKREGPINLPIGYPIFPISVKYNKGTNLLKSYILEQLCLKK
ncbi:50S ribosome-binding GTPase [candidate division WOR-3 bacterium]|nr:50S ribosome-binding GTPase [candidate division WOR-3 bacterium]